MPNNANTFQGLQALQGQGIGFASSHEHWLRPETPGVPGQGIGFASSITWLRPGHGQVVARRQHTPMTGSKKVENFCETLKLLKFLGPAGSLGNFAKGY